MIKGFKDIVADACAVEQEFRKLNADGRMSPEAIIQGCYTYGGTNEAKVAELKSALQERELRLRATRAFISQAYKGIVEGRYAGGAPRDISRMAMPSRDEARQELAEIGHNLWTAWAIAVEDAKSRHSEVFGSVGDPLEWQWRLDTLKAKRAELFQRIAESFEPNDLIISDIKSDGRALVTMTIAPQVTLRPLGSLGERLVNHLLREDPQKWGGGKTSHALLKNNRKGSTGIQVAG